MRLPLLPPSPRRVRVQLPLLKTLPSVSLLEPQVAVVLCHPRLGIQEGKPQLPLSHHPGVELGSIFKGFLSVVRRSKGFTRPP